MKNLDLSIKITICDPTARDSKLILEDGFNVDKESIGAVWSTVCKNAELHSVIFSMPHMCTIVEFKFEILIGDEVLNLTLGKPVETPIQLFMYNEIKDLFSKIKLALEE